MTSRRWLCWILVTVVVSARPLDRIRAPFVAKTTRAPYTSIGSLSLNHENITSGCTLIANGETLWEGNLRDSTPAAVETMAMVCDVLVVATGVDDELDEDTLESLRSGWSRRGEADLRKSRLIIVAPKRSKLLREIKKMSKGLVQSVRMVSSMKNVKECRGDATSASLLPSDAFPALFNEVCSTLSGSQIPVLETARPEVSEAALHEIEEVADTTEEELAILDKAFEALNALEAEQQDSMISTDGIPMNFAASAHAVLDQLRRDVEDLADVAVASVQEQVGQRMKYLFDQHMQGLRDFHGSLYERLLDEYADRPETWSKHAATVTEGFRRLAQESVPMLTRQGEIFRDMDLDYVSALQGLIADMMEATEMRQEETFDEDEDDIAVDSKPSLGKKLPAWARKLAARALVLGVNYVQGWLAWQGIQRAALERERNMPKFPLF